MTDAPSPYRPPAPPELSWWWRLEDASGQEVTVSSEYADQRFPSQGDAESWVGEFWRELSEEGVAAVVLFEHDRQVYGPMSLEA
jgi:hypothetical protein